MEIIRHIKNHNKELPDILKNFFNQSNFLIFDIETTGLNPSYNKIILIGLLYLENNTIVIEQYLCENSSEEPKLLEAFKEKISKFDFYITYNGGNFDIPFINKRLLNNNINFQIDPFYNIDLYKIVRKSQKSLNIENCKLKTVEKFLGIYREDTISGEESVLLYKQYEKTLNTHLKSKILLHNYEDILYLLPTLDILNFIDKNVVLSYLPQEILTNNDLKIRIKDHKIKKDFLYVFGEFKENITQDYIHYDISFSFNLLKESKEFNLKIPLLNIKLKNKDTISFINVDEISIFDTTLAEMDDDERNSYIIKVNNITIFSNLHNFIKYFISELLKKVKL